MSDQVAGDSPGSDMPQSWDAAQRFAAELRSFGPKFTGKTHRLSSEEAWSGPGRLYVRCENLGVQGILQSFAPNGDECVVALRHGSVKVPRVALAVLEEEVPDA